MYLVFLLYLKKIRIILHFYHSVKNFVIFLERNYQKLLTVMLCAQTIRFQITTFTQILYHFPNLLNFLIFF